MRLLCIDVGAGTQDILVFDSSQTAENWVQLILPSPTQIVASQIESATRKGQAVLLTGVTMGGGPNWRAARHHMEAGLPLYATPDAARTFNDDLDEVTARGVRLISPDEAVRLTGVYQVETKDLQVEAIASALNLFGIPTNWDGLGVAVLDHGAAPKGMSDRLFRFQYLKAEVEAKQELPTLAYFPSELPPFLTRMQAVVSSAPDLPLLLLDTGAAAALGAGLDPIVARHPHRLSLNSGNMHTLGLHLMDNRILGLFEHHTGPLSRSPGRLRELTLRFLRGELTNQEVWDDGGHGCFILERGEGKPFVVATGPRRELVRQARLRAHLAAPYGDMMLTGCYGLLRAWAAKKAEWREEIERALGH